MKRDFNNLSEKDIEEFEEFLIANRDEKLDLLSQYNANRYKDIADYLESIENIVGMEIKAYSYYCGNRCYQQDYYKSRDLLLKLYRITGDGFYANSLGYIYYYGRCNTGKPQYEEAFKYYSIGACYGIYESRYKLADMFSNGFYVEKNDILAFKLVNGLYDENVRDFLYNDLDNKFADVARRLGTYFENGTFIRADVNFAYRYYLKAALAIEERIKLIDYAGDRAVALKIKDAIKDVLPYTDYQTVKNTYEFDNLFHFFIINLDITEDVSVKCYKMDKQKYVLNFESVNGCDMLITIPECHYCKRLSSFSLMFTEKKARGFISRLMKNGDSTFTISNSDETRYKINDEYDLDKIAGEFSFVFETSVSEIKPEDVVAFEVDIYSFFGPPEVYSKYINQGDGSYLVVSNDIIDSQTIKLDQNEADTLVSNLLNDGHVAIWDKEYDCMECEDGSSWESRLVLRNGTIIKSYGNNAYPDEFDEVMKLMKLDFRADDVCEENYNDEI